MFLLLSGCADTRFEPIANEVTPSVQGYSEEFQDQLLDEFLTCTKCEALKIALNDYLVMRDEARVVNTTDIINR